MEEEIDLQPYLEVLFRRAKWIVGSALVFAIITFLIISSQQKSYKATALVFVAVNNNVFLFDPRIQEVTNKEPLTALPELAESDMVLSTLIKDEALVEVKTIENLRIMLQAESGSDRSLIRLTATSKDPLQSANIANLWAELFVTQINSILGIQNSEQGTFFETQLAQAEQTLRAAEDDLIAFQEINRSSTISNTLTSYNREQTLHLANQQVLRRLIQDTEQLRDQLSNLPGTSPVPFSDQLTALTLQMEGFSAETSNPVLLQLDADIPLIGPNKNEQIAFLVRLSEYLQFKLSVTESRLTELEPEILQLQQDWQEAVVTYNRLVNSRLIANETYLSLARKVEEEKITTQDTNRGLRLISQAVPPNDSESRNTLIFTLAGGIIGALISVAVLFAVTWWHQIRGDLSVT